MNPAATANTATDDARRTRAEELAALLETRRGERHVVAIQDFPDPDAISSGLAYQEIAAAFGIRADVMYDGQISHPENLALVNLLEIELLRYERSVPLDRYDAAVFVDNQGTTTHLAPRLRDARVPTLAVIDHHDPQELLDPVFTDIRPVGAAVTLIVEYLRSGALLTLDAREPRHTRLATALMHGLHSETDRFIHARQAEYDAAAFLSPLVEPELLERVLCVEKSRAALAAIETALAKRVLRSGWVTAGAGYLRWADRDAIPQAADFLVTEENVHTVVVYGILQGDEGREVVSGSLRTRRPTLAVDAFLKEALGEDEAGQAYGGGRSRAGGFEIRMGFLQGGEPDPEQQAVKWRLFDQQIRNKIFRTAGVLVDDDEDDEEPPAAS
jgi:nanoRNase/pAp phosphatase (c-di-AMP/oligoRNAs hydrolase)